MSKATKPIIGLALGSGVARGWAHIGVIKALRRYGIEPDIIVGTSSGALVGGAYLAGHLDVLESWTRGLNRRRILSYLDFRVRSSGLIGGAKLMKAMEENLGHIQIQDLPKPFAVIATDMITGHEIWIRDGRMVDALRASFSLPGVFPPVKINNRWLIDGALVNPVPVGPCQALGADMIIGVDLNADLHGKLRREGSSVPVAAGFDLLKQPSDMAESVSFAQNHSLTRRIFRRDSDEPSLFGVMVSSLNIVQSRLAKSRLAGHPPDVLITPRIGHIGLLEFDRAADAISLGEAAVERSWPDIQAALAVFG